MAAVAAQHAPHHGVKPNVGEFVVWSPVEFVDVASDDHQGHQAMYASPNDLRQRLGIGKFCTKSTGRHNFFDGMQQ